jgi:hypothetical protein
MKVHENPSSGSGLFHATGGWTDGQTDIRTGGRTEDRQTDRQTDRETAVKTLTVDYRSFANASENVRVERKISIGIHSSSKALFSILILYYDIHSYRQKHNTGHLEAGYIACNKTECTYGAMLWRLH